MTKESTRSQVRFTMKQYQQFKKSSSYLKIRNIKVLIKSIYNVRAFPKCIFERKTDCFFMAKEQNCTPKKGTLLVAWNYDFIFLGPSW